MSRLVIGVWTLDADRGNRLLTTFAVNLVWRRMTVLAGARTYAQIIGLDADWVRPRPRVGLLSSDFVRLKTVTPVERAFSVRGALGVAHARTST